jgi:hypothetical protein
MTDYAAGEKVPESLLAPHDRQSRFLAEIEILVHEKGCSLIEAVIHFASVNNCEVESLADIIKANLKLLSRITAEGEQLHFIKKVRRLPV